MRSLDGWDGGIRIGRALRLVAIFNILQLVPKVNETVFTSSGHASPTFLVTGGTGFIGSHTVEHLIARGFRVRCLVRSNRQHLHWLHGLPVEIVQADLLNPSTLPHAVEGADYILHIAGITKARRRAEYFAGNASATEHLVNAAIENGHVRKFCLISSLSAVGPSATGIPVTEQAHCRPITTYGESKVEAERIVRRHGNRLPYVILRPPAVFGPRDPDILLMFKWIERGLKPVIGSPQKTLSLVYAPDLARAMVDATLADRSTRETYFVADPAIFTLSSLLDYLATFLHRRTLTVYIPRSLVYSMAGVMQFISAFGRKPAILNLEKARDILQNHWVCSPRKIEDHLGYRTRTSVYDGLRITFRWYKSIGWL